MKKQKNNGTISIGSKIKFPAMFLSALAMATLVLTTTSAKATLIDILGGGGGVTASTEFADDGRLTVNLINGSGLAAGNHSIAVGDQWLSEGTCCNTSLDPAPTVTFDLGAVYKISSFHVWNYNEHQSNPFGINRGVNNLTINYGATAGLGSTLGAVTSLTIAPLAATNPGTNYSGFAPFVARHIELDINPGVGDGNYGDTNFFYGLAEVQFDGVLVPEPSTFALFGLAGAGLMMLRRRKRA
jgi:hypothetical protein